MGRSGTEAILATVCCNAGFPSETLSQDRKVGLGRFGGVEFFFFSLNDIPFRPISFQREGPVRLPNGHANAKFSALY